jgi:hypothetical protein
VVCFEPHLVTGLGLPPSKFFVAIMNFLGCELVHFNSDAIAAHGCFAMLCECLLGIESASRPLVDFVVLNDNLIKGLILCVKCLSRF